MCAPGLCAEGSALFAVLQTSTGKKVIQLTATTITEAHDELQRVCTENEVLLYFETRSVRP